MDFANFGQSLMNVSKNSNKKTMIGDLKFQF